MLASIICWYQVIVLVCNVLVYFYFYKVSILVCKMYTYEIYIYIKTLQKFNLWFDESLTSYIETSQETR